MSLTRAKPEFEDALKEMLAVRAPGATGARTTTATGSSGTAVAAASAQGGVALAESPSVQGLDHGAVVIAAITSCTNTSNPSVMIAAGLLAKNAVERGLTVQPWVKTSLAPGSMVVTEYLKAAELLGYLERLGFSLVGVRLHDMHWQQWTSARRGVCRRQGTGPRGGVGIEWQPELRGPYSAAGARQLSRVPPSGRRLRVGRTHERRSHH